jgi:hypothetical protein
MPTPDADTRSPDRRARDEAIASQPKLPPLALPTDSVPKPIESHLRSHRPLAVAGIVENGLVRPLDPDVKLHERSRVIIVAAD